MQPISDEAHKVIKYLIQSCPYGEQQEVLKDIEKLQPINYESIRDDLRHHNQQHLAIISDNEHKVITFEHAYHDGKYCDQVRGKSFTIDPQTNTITNTQDYQSGLPEQVIGFLGGLEAKLKQYLVKYFKQTQGLQVWCQENGDLKIGITAKNLNFANYYGGEWISVWTLAGTQLQGLVKVHTHFFEGGNVQLHQSKVIGPVEIPHSENLIQRAASIVSSIQKLQGQLQSNLATLYEEIPDQFFKSLRRVIPFTKTKMDWNVATLSIKQSLQSMTANKN